MFMVLFSEYTQSPLGYFTNKVQEDTYLKIGKLQYTSFQQIEADVHDSFKAILQAGFTQFDLVTREEFDAQVKVLARTREKVEALQKQLDTLLGEKTR